MENDLRLPELYTLPKRKKRSGNARLPPQSPSRKQVKMILTLCKPLFIVNARVKGLFKVILEYKNEAPQLEKWARHMHNEIV